MSGGKRIKWKIRIAMTQEAKWSELHEVCANGDTDLLEEMLISGKYEQHVDYKDPDWGERAPLHWCCIRGTVQHVVVDITMLQKLKDVL